MPVNDELGKRMKTFYEQVPKTRLMRRCPVAIRIDGKAFHTFTKGFKRPFDRVLMASMQETMKYLCENIQGCVFGYTQSDEITLILVDYQKLDTSAWFDYEVQKLCSISSSMATAAFMRSFSCNVNNYKKEKMGDSQYLCDEDEEYITILEKASNKGALFDARCFNIPKEEVTNLIYWRQIDAARNSVQMVGQANFSHKEIQGKSCSDIQNMLLTQRGINWNDYPVECKRGTACIKTETKVSADRTAHSWIIDYNMPILKGDGREYVEKLVNL